MIYTEGGILSLIYYVHVAFHKGFQYSVKSKKSSARSCLAYKLPLDDHQLCINDKNYFCWEKKVTGGYSSKVIYHDFCLQTYCTVVPKLLYGVFIWPFTQSFYCVIFLMK